MQDRYASKKPLIFKGFFDYLHTLHTFAYPFHKVPHRLSLPGPSGTLSIYTNIIYRYARYASSRKTLTAQHFFSCIPRYARYAKQGEGVCNLKLCTAVHILTIISHVMLNSMKSLQTILIFEARKNRSMNTGQPAFKVVMNLINAAVFMRFKFNHYTHE